MKKYSIVNSFDSRIIPDSYIVNYVNSGYSFFEHITIIRLIRSLRKRGVKGLIFFHEAYAAKGHIYNRSYWLQAAEKIIFKYYVQSGARLCCSCKPIADHISEYLPNGISIIIAPIPSNVLFVHLAPWDKRINGLVVFGTYGRRISALKERKRILDLIEFLGINQVYDIGQGVIDYSWLPSKVSISVLGYVESNVYLSKTIGSARFGLIDYPEYLLGKSGIFAAYAAAGLCIINTDTSAVINPTGHTFSYTSILNSDIDRFKEMSLRMINYYHTERSVEVHVDRILKAIVG